MSDPTRRDLLKTAWKVGAGLLVVEGVWTTVEALRPLAEDDGGGLVTLSPPDAYAEETATYVQQAKLFVTRVKGELFAIDQKCPHLGCKVGFCEASGRFECPCHGSKYDLAGEWIEGPSPHGMNRRPLEVRDGRVVVDLGTIEEGPPLGADEYLTPPRGGTCTSGES